MCSSSDIGLEELDFCLYLVSKLVEHFEDGFATDRGEVGLLK